MVDISPDVETLQNNPIISGANLDLNELPEIYRIKPQLFKPGQSGNPNGKAPGTKNAVTIGGPIAQETLDKLQTYSKPELIALIKKVSGAVWGVGMMSEDEAFDAVKLKLLHTGLNSDSSSAFNALKEWSDRTKGKAAQSISMKVDVDPLSKLSNDRLIKLEQSLAKMTGQEAVLIPPMPDLLEE